MLLYRLQNKQTGQFFCHVQPYSGKITWNDKGSFFRTIDTMRKHLAYLIGEYVERENDGFPRRTKYKGSLHYKYSKRWDEGRYVYKENGFKFRLSRLKYYQVVVTDVTVKGEKIIQGTDFAGGLPI